MTVLLLSLLGCASALQLGAPTLRTCVTASRCARIHASSPAPPEDEDEALAAALRARQEAAKQDQPDGEDDSLLASFNARLDQEGGRTQFKLRTDAQRVAEDAKDAGNALKRGIEAAGDALPKPSGDRSGLVAILGVIAVISVLTAVLGAGSGPPPDADFYTPQLGVN